jgi:hypothetical protein
MFCKSKFNKYDLLRTFQLFVRNLRAWQIALEQARVSQPRPRPNSPSIPAWAIDILDNSNIKRIFMNKIKFLQ